MLRTLILALLFTLACGDNKTTLLESVDPGRDASVDVPKTISDTKVIEKDIGKKQDLGLPPGIAEVIFEQKGVPITESQSAIMEFVVPPNTKSVLIMMSGKTTESFSAASWKNGDGTDLVPQGWTTGEFGGSFCTTCPNRVIGLESVGTAYAPNNQSVTLKPGTHEFSVFAFKQIGLQLFPLPETKVDVLVFANTFIETPIAKLALNFHFTGAEGLTAESAKTSVTFQAEIELFEALFDEAKIEIDDITYVDIDPAFQIIENTISPDSDLQKMFKLGESLGEPGDGTRRGINIFFVDELLLEEDAGFGILGGFSGGIPGPIVNGTDQSGVAVAMKDYDGVLTAGSILAHELLHYLGLFHTTEDSGYHDQISDTPANDNTLLMYHAPIGQTISPNQIEVIRNNPWLVY